MSTYTRRSTEQWQHLVDEQRASQLSAPQFCKQHDIGYASFCQWRKRLAGASATQATPVASHAAPAFLAVEPAPARLDHPEWMVELQLGAGVVLRVGKC